MARSTPLLAPARRRRRAAAVAMAVLLGAGAQAPGAPAAAPSDAPRADPRDTAGRLDLTEASLEQRDVRMFLRIATAGEWTHADLGASPGRSLCVTLTPGTPGAGGSLCVSSHERRPALTYTPPAAGGAPQVTRRLAARVTQPSPGVLQASFLPVAAGLPVGPYAWSVQSTWTDDAACARACADRLPDGGDVGAQLGLLGAAPCFGAAARDPAQPCENPDLRLAVQPAPARAKVRHDPYCDRQTHPGLLSTCAFGAAPEDATATFALIGDSHAASLKVPLEVVTLGRRWRGISIVRATCPATQAAKPILRTRDRARQCVRWNREVLAWLAEHRDVRTVFLSAYAGAQVGRAGAAGMFATARTGYRDEIRRLLRHVRRVVVVRDVPTAAPGHLRCVAAALREGGSPGTTCTQPRGRALRRDPLAAAARSLQSPRVQLIDLTDRFCDDRRCYPVIGGALVHHDRTHMTSVFAATLGPFILRALE
jgi:SGNH domain-containing protein